MAVLFEARQGFNELVVDEFVDGQVCIASTCCGCSGVALTDDQAAELEAALRRRRHALPFKNMTQGENQ